VLQTWCVIIEAHAGVRCAVPLLSGVAGGGREGGGDDGECRGAMRPGQGASVVARVQVWWPRRAECGGDREALASTNPMLAVSSVHAVVSQGASGSERR
jgi:hypothetical protein